MGLRSILLVIVSTIGCLQAAAAGSFDCPVPIATPDRWDDLSGDQAYDLGEPYDATTTGFDSNDQGISLMLYFSGNPGPSQLGQYYVVEFPPLGGEIPPYHGEEWTRKWLAECSPYPVAAGDSVQLVPGALILSVVSEELAARVAQDPDAYWDEETLTIQGSQFVESPRLITVPAYDPRYGPDATRGYLKITKLLAVFVESVGPGTQVMTRLVDAGLAGGTPTVPTTWGTIKNRY